MMGQAALSQAQMDQMPVTKLCRRHLILRMGLQAPSKVLSAERKLSLSQASDLQERAVTQ
jgi:hypothetical protein